jgi:hypothetical protein
MADEQKGRCVGCGYLSWRVFNDERGECHEVTEDERKSGERPNAGPALQCSRAPQCYQRVPIHKEYADLSASGLNHDEKYLKVIRLDRGCPKFCVYQPGESPKRHAEMAAEAKADEVKAKAAESEEDKAERRHRADLIYRIMEDQERRNWEDARDQEKREHDKAMAVVQNKRDADQFNRDVVRMVLSGIGVVGMFCIGQAVGPCGKNTTATTQTTASEPAK